jgi:prepilin peptidase CpaA
MTLTLLPQICAAALVAAAAVTDMLSRRIPNWLTLSGVLGGLLLHTATGGFGGFKLSAGGMLLGFGSYLVLYSLRAMGAGDVKLMAAVGAILGPSNWVSVFVATALAGGILAMVLIVVKGRTRETLWNVWYIANELLHFRAPHKRRSDMDVRDPNALNMPHGVAIAAGTAIWMLSGSIA